jgi:hypothetical protein
MISPVRVLPLLVLLALVLASHPGYAFPVLGDTAPLEFHGFRAGARLDEVQARVRSLDGGRLRCERAKKDRRLTECRAVLDEPELGGPVDLWVSAIDSVAGVVTLSSRVTADQLDRWRQAIERRYGRVDAQIQGPQWMMQWVRRGRMLRLTWRIERGEKVASVSLVDGRVLDGWGGGRRRG